MTRIIKASLETSMVGGDEQMEFDAHEDIGPDCTDEQIEKYVREWFFNICNYGWTG